MRVSLISPGDIEFHFKNLLKVETTKFDFEVEGIAKALQESDSEIILLPDKGVSLNVARVYKKRGGKRIIGALPLSDKIFGTKHLEPYIHMNIEKSPLFDGFINTENWFKHDLIKGLLGNALIYLGDSPGTNGELNYAVYLYKVLSGRKEGVEVAGKFIHPEIKAGRDFTIFVFTPFLINKRLSPELEEYIKKSGINLVYFNSSRALKDELEKLRKN